MNADLHMADDLNIIGRENRFIIFGEPDIDFVPVKDDSSGTEKYQVRFNDFDICDPTPGRIAVNVINHRSEWVMKAFRV